MLSSSNRNRMRKLKKPIRIFNSKNEQQNLFKIIVSKKMSNTGSGNCLWYSFLQGGIFPSNINCPNDARSETVVQILTEFTSPKSYLRKLVNKQDLTKYLNKINTESNWTDGIDQIGYEIIFYTLSKYFNKCIILIINTPEMKISKIYNKYSRTRVFIYLSSEHYEYCNCADDSFLQDIDISNFETIMP